MAARKMTTRRVVLETLVVVGIFGVVHLPIYPRLHSTPEKTVQAPVATVAAKRTDCPQEDAAAPAVATADKAPCPALPKAATD